MMPKTRTTLTVDEEVLKAVRIKAARTGKRDSEVIEESLRRDLGLDELERIWARVKPISEQESLDLAYAELDAMRMERDAPGGP
jgi:gamma-glutamyl:cysteine ligase YbdK (ATP-grasp superfamily)